MNFESTYQYLISNSTLLKKTDCGKAEIYETGSSLLTIVDLERKEFWTKTKEGLGPNKYEQTKKEFAEL